ncbi:MAG TPA: hypothetical protein VEF89_14620 [Solirubrobacteraceae bacterium]|nr:hypothetical protein [Solirubrobacteraceae bacterium]
MYSSAPDIAGAVQLIRAGYVMPASPRRRDRKPPDDQALLFALWQTSHFGWIAESTIRRTVIVSGVQESLGDSLAECLRRLLTSGWVDEQRYDDAGGDEREWRLTDSGRDALARQD